VARATTDQSLAGQQVIVTSGATTESIDPIRTLSNRASGKTGRAVARACHARSADVVLVHDGEDLPWATVEQVESAAEMLAAVQEHADEADALVSAAAISDYTVDAAPEKIRSGQTDLTLDLTPTPKLIDSVREANPELPIVGFKAESESTEENIVEQARRIRDRAGLAFVVGNAADVMGDAETRAAIVDSDVEWIEGAKTDLGGAVADRLGVVVEEK
jgi:phosphopantothenoylcysteine decarboxylase/phosphopantothenate--cysteine ligase